MATSITKEGIQLVKQEETEINLEDDQALPLINGEIIEQQGSSQESSTNVNVSTNASPLNTPMSGNYGKNEGHLTLEAKLKVMITIKAMVKE